MGMQIAKKTMIIMLSDGRSGFYRATYLGHLCVQWKVTSSAGRKMLVIAGNVALI